jgi:hypothetical protein
MWAVQGSCLAIDAQHSAWALMVAPSSRLDEQSAQKTVQVVSDSPAGNKERVRRRWQVNGGCSTNHLRYLVCW